MYLQLEALKERNVRLNNRHLVERIAAMQEAASTVSNTIVTNTIVNNKVIVSETTKPIKKCMTENQLSTPVCKPYQTTQQTDEVDCKFNFGASKDVHAGNKFDAHYSPNECRISEILEHKNDLPLNAIVKILKPKSSLESMSDSDNLDCVSIRAVKSNLSVDNLSVFDGDYNTNSEIFSKRISKSFCDKVRKKSLRRYRSNTEARLSDGIVMKPILTALWPSSMSDHFIIANHCSGGVMKYLQSPSTCQNQVGFDRTDMDSNIQTSKSQIFKAECSTQTSNVDRFMSASVDRPCAGSDRAQSLIEERLSLSSELNKPSHSSCLYDATISVKASSCSDLKKLLPESVRLYHSLDNINESFCHSGESCLHQNLSCR